MRCMAISVARCGAGGRAPSRRSAMPVCPSGTPRRPVWKRLLFLRFLVFQRHRYGRLVLEWVNGRPFLVLPRVFNPGLFASGRLLAEQVERRTDLLSPRA